MDVDFNHIQLTLLAIFNQEMAYLNINITKQNNSYIPYCTVMSTFCNHSNPL